VAQRVAAHHEAMYTNLNFQIAETRSADVRRGLRRRFLGR
jgi:hypothetical protein